MFVYARFTQLTRFINENRQLKLSKMKNLFREVFVLRSKGVQFEIRDDKRTSALKELQGHFEVNLSKPACRATVSKNFAKKKLFETKNRSIRKVFKLKYKC